MGGREGRRDFQRNLRTLLAEVRADVGSRT
jgi:hypothetical protein